MGKTAEETLEDYATTKKADPEAVPATETQPDIPAPPEPLPVLGYERDGQ